MGNRYGLCALQWCIRASRCPRALPRRQREPSESCDQIAEGGDFVRADKDEGRGRFDRCGCGLYAACSRLANASRQLRFDVHMHVFKLRIERKAAGSDFGFDLSQALLDVPELLVTKNARVAQGPGMRDAPRMSCR